MQVSPSRDIIPLKMYEGDFFMSLNRDTVELLAPAGTWDAFVAAIEAGADAVYLGGKHFNMRVHKDDFNLDDEQLEAAVEYAHARNVKLDIALNNLISEEELVPLEKYLQFLAEIRPDAIIVQDLSVIKIIRRLGLDIPIHASVMMNVNNFHAIEMLKRLGVERVVVGRELSLAEVSLLRERTGIEVEYFVHGDMCFAVSGQCTHSGVIFGQSGSRGRCLKPCRWAWKFVDEETGAVIDDTSYKFAMHDMCMLRNIPDMIQAGVYSFKIEGRMRPPEFIRELVSAYRRVIDEYTADPTGFNIDENLWREFFNRRVRNFTTMFAFNRPDKRDIGLSGKREPRFFSEGIVEKSFDDADVQKIFEAESAIKDVGVKPKLSVRVSTVDSAESAVNNGADVIYIGGEIFKPLKPWTIGDIKVAVEIAHANNVEVILNTPRVTKDKYLNELAELLNKLRGVDIDGVIVSNIGALKLVSELSDLPVYADASFNVFNHVAVDLLKDFGVRRAVASLEMSFAQLRSVVENSALPIEVIVHGATESMISEHNLIKLYHPDYDEFATPELLNQYFALEDSAREVHSVRIDQFGYSHIYFAKDLCMLPYLAKFMGAAVLRIEAQDYSAEVVGLVTKIYRAAIDKRDFGTDFDLLKKITPRRFGCGVYRFQRSKNSI